MHPGAVTNNARPDDPDERSVGPFDFMKPEVKMTEDGLIPAIVQEALDGSPDGGRVLMFAWMNQDSLAKTLETGLMHYWSRSRKMLWLKGESSGHTQRVVSSFVDCDRDVLLFQVKQEGGACHTGYRSCFFQKLEKDGSDAPIEEERLFDPAAVYR